MSSKFIESVTYLILLEPTLGEKSRLARSLPNVLGRPGPESLVPHRQRPFTPA